MRSPRLLLVNPRNSTSFWGGEYMMDLVGASHSNAPLSVLTVAALTPDDWQIEIADENVRPVDLDTPCDIVGITAMNVQASRAFVIADAFRRRGRTVVIGGPYATLQPERCAPHADIIVAGEAERTWPQFCRDFARGEHRSSYVETAMIDLAESPVPRYDLIRRTDYATMPLQTSRGCPFNCEFCDIIVMQGRRVRTKPIQNVLAELEALRGVGADTIFFTDDNFVGNLKYARELLTGMIEQNAHTGWAPMITTQATVNLAEKPRVLELMVRAGFTRVFLGVETPRRASLLEAGKRHNTHGDLVARIHKIQEAGLMIWAGMIVGFDNDDVGVFAEQVEFLEAASIPVAMVGMLNAPPKTPLFERLTAEGRIDANADWADNCAWTNIIPKQMTRAQLFGGYADLVEEIYRQENFARRVLGNIARMGNHTMRENAASRLPSSSELHSFWRAFTVFGLTRDPIRRRHFWPNLFRVMLAHPSHAVEAAIHLGMWKHYETYVPELVAKLRAAEGVERVRLREDCYHGVAQSLPEVAESDLSASALRLIPATG